MNTEVLTGNKEGLNEESYFFFRLLSEIEGIGVVKIKNLYKYFTSFPAIFSASLKELTLVEGISPELASRIHGADKISQDLKKRITKESNTLFELGGRCVMIWDEEYPARLKKIYDPPIALYILGNIIKEDENSIGVVGTRQPSPYGKQSAEFFSKELVKSGWTVVSGLARGIDTAAHIGALKAGGRTIAVLGSGLDKVYPAENKKLADAIVKNGAVITEYPIGTKPDAGNFPKRNRIISGLSRGVLIVETKVSGGALITARYAIDQNREVYAVPGSVFYAGAEGGNLIIKKSEAKLVSKVSDILEDFGDVPMMQGKAKEAPKVHHNLNLFEQKIVKCLSEQAISIDNIAHMTSFSVSDCLVNLLQLEFKGIVKQLPGKMFILE